MSLVETGGLICKLSKQKLNTKSLTGVEFVGARDYLPNTLWLKMFLEAQGYQIQEIFLEQDNESAIWLENNDQAFLDQGQHQRRRHHNSTLSNVGDVA